MSLTANRSMANTSPAEYQKVEENICIYCIVLLSPRKNCTCIASAIKKQVFKLEEPDSIFHTFLEDHFTQELYREVFDRFNVKNWMHSLFIPRRKTT